MGEQGAGRRRRRRLPPKGRRWKIRGVATFGQVIGDLLEGSGFSDLLGGAKWTTLKNGKRIKLSSDGRIVQGMPARYHGTHVRDLVKLSHEERKLQGIDCEDLRSHCHTCKKTFRSKDEAYAAILRVNPELDELRQSEFGQYDLAFLKWQRNGRRGPKPRTAITDGRLDAINEFYDLKGAARVGSFTEAIYQTIPASRKWEDLAPRLARLEEAAGFHVNPPDELTKLEVGKLDAQACAEEVDRKLGELFAKARDGRLEEKPEGASGGADDGHAPPGERSDDTQEVPF